MEGPKHSRVARFNNFHVPNPGWGAVTWQDWADWPMVYMVPRGVIMSYTMSSCHSFIDVLYVVVCCYHNYDADDY